MTPWLADPDVTLWHGDCLDVLRELPSASVHMCATSPPFYGLRDYGVEGQIGLEESPDEWVAGLVDVFREVKRVLRDDGTLWVEIGDSYGAPNSGSTARRVDGGTPHRTAIDFRHPTKPKDLLGQPWLLAFALRADGWYLRSEIIWARPNPMPESVTDRPTKSHSTVFLLSKRSRYFFDADAIREDYKYGFSPASGNTFGAARRGAPNDCRDTLIGTVTRGSDLVARDRRLNPQSETLDGSEGEAPRGPDGRRQTGVKAGENSEQHRDGERWPNPAGANARSVWTIPTEPTPFAHFATWPQKLVARMILAGTSSRGCCPECGAPWVRETSLVRPEKDVERIRNVGGRTDGFTRPRASGGLPDVTVTTLGWSPSCVHDHEPVPCTVLDPFAGSGTTMLVARNHGRRSVGIELNLSYLEICAGRLSQLSLLTEASA